MGVIDHTTEVWLRFPLFCGTLSIRRVPKYLRFACSNITSPDRTWDALDQLDDEPRDGERLIVGRLVDQTRMHLDRIVDGKKVGEWYATAAYELVNPQPDAETIRDTTAWRAWVMAEIAKSAG